MNPGPHEEQDAFFTTEPAFHVFAFRPPHRVFPFLTRMTQILETCQLMILHSL